MKPGFGPTELQRALARDDVDKLRRELADAFKWHQWFTQGEDESTPEAERGIYWDSHWNDRDGRLALTALAMAEYDDPAFLGLVAAGLLEDAIVNVPSEDNVSDELLGRVVDEARRTPRFRWMLSGVWTYSCSPKVADTIKQAVGTANMDTDPLPPRPHA